MILLLLASLAVAAPPSSASAVLTVTAYVVGPCPAEEQTVTGATMVCGAAEGRQAEVPPAADLVKAGYVPDSRGYVEVDP
jgi:hypothetical protein